jgi:large subunit ribosomal protein L25
VYSEDIALVLEKRDVVGKGLGKLKAAGKVPAVIHRPGKDSLVVAGLQTDVDKVIKKAGKHHPVQITVGSDKLLTIIKEVDLDPAKRTLRHVVFGAINQNEKVHTDVPIELVGEAPALKAALLVHQNLEVFEISALPKDLPDSIKVSVEGLVEVGDKINVGDVKPPAGIEILDDPEHPVVTVDAPHVQAEEPEESPAEQEAAAIAEISEESAEDKAE